MKFGIRSVSMDNISAALGISKKTIYQYYESKDDLVGDCIMTYAQCQNEMIVNEEKEAADAIEEMINIARRLVGVLDNISRKAMFDLKKYYGPMWETMNEMKTQSINVTLSNNLKKGKESGLYRTDITDHIIVNLYISKVNAVIENDFFEDQGFRRSSVYLQLLSYHMYGILTVKGIEIFKNRYAQLVGCINGTNL